MGPIIGWLLVTANNVARNHARTARRHRIAMAKLPPSVPQPDHADELLRHARIRLSLGHS
jgi:DNA-directed RNA polymerase specialized sigma24 family protein